MLQCFGRSGRPGKDGTVETAVCVNLWNNTDLACAVVTDPVRKFCCSKICL